MIHSAAEKGDLEILEILIPINKENISVIHSGHVGTLLDIGFNSKPYLLV